jgi:hypothetical protein
MISKEILEKFKTLYKKKYDIDLTYEQTTQLANDLVNLMRILLKPESKAVENEVQQEEGRQNETIGTTQY